MNIKKTIGRIKNSIEENQITYVLFALTASLLGVWVEFFFDYTEIIDINSRSIYYGFVLAISFFILMLIERSIFRYLFDQKEFERKLDIVRAAYEASNFKWAITASELEEIEQDCETIVYIAREIQEELESNSQIWKNIVHNINDDSTLKIIYILPDSDLNRSHAITLVKNLSESNDIKLTEEEIYEKMEFNFVNTSDEKEGIIYYTKVIFITHSGNQKIDAIEWLPHLDAKLYARMDRHHAERVQSDIRAAFPEFKL